MEKVLNYIKSHKAFLISIFIYIVITLTRLINHQPWYDEAHAWTIAQQTNIIELFKLMKYEGHTVTWFLILMPFAKNNILYPYSMQFINWVFCITAICFMWQKAPFNNLIKILITFAYPYFTIYPILARCYSMGILIFFIIASLYKNRLKRPFLYSVLIILASNTSVMAATGASILGILFFIDLIIYYKNKEIELSKVVYSFTILSAGALFLLAQLAGAKSSQIAGLAQSYTGIHTRFFAYAFIFNMKINIALLICFTLAIVPLLFKDKHIAIFLTATYIMLLSIFNFVYIGNVWHYYFFLTYLIIAFWIYLSENKVNEKSIIYKLAIYAFTLLLFITCIDFRYPKYNIYNSESATVSNMILNDHILRDSRIITYDAFDLKILPYLTNHNIEVFDYCQNAPASYKADRSVGICSIKNAINPYYLIEQIPENKKTYSLVSLDVLTQEQQIAFDNKIETEDFIIRFKPYKCTKYNCFFENSISRKKR